MDKQCPFSAERRTMTAPTNVARIQIERESLRVMSQDDIDRMAKKE